jgi:DNA modification methylase
MINNLALQDEGWRKYQNDITTEAIWVSSKSDKYTIPQRGFENDQDFHGIFIHEIPYQMILRYTKEKETVWDCFAGSGTTHEIAKFLNRNSINNDLNPQKDYIQQGDSRYFNPNQKIQLAIMHPPYHNIVKYSNDGNDLSCCDNLNNFYLAFTEVVKNVNNYLESKRFLILVCGHIYYNGEDVPVGHDCMNIIRRFGYKCKGIIVKDYGETKNGHKKRANLEYYRALKNGTWKFAGDNIFVMQKQ